MLDIHSHILPEIDDGAQNLEESIALLQMLKDQGVTNVIATPHFYPHEDSLVDFKENSALAYKTLLNTIKGKDLPKVFLGCEILYFEGMGHSQSLGGLCLCNSNYLLIELTDEYISDSLISNLLHLIENTDIIPIIAHVERYCKAKNYKKFIKFLKREEIIVQINASSFLESFFDRTIQKLMKSGLEIVIGSDAHSVEMRPPQISEAFDVIRKKYGDSAVNGILRNMNKIEKDIVERGI